MQPQKALFLDRDGVINIDKGYVCKPEQFEWVPGIIELMQRFKKAGFLIIVVTNQSGIGRGYYTESDFHNLTQWMQLTLGRYGVTIDDVKFCPNHPTEAKGQYLRACSYRKPEPGMLLEAIAQWHIDVSQSLIIGDSWRDIQAGVGAQLAKCYFYSEHINQDQLTYAEKVASDIIQVSNLAAIVP